MAAVSDNFFCPRVSIIQHWCMSILFSYELIIYVLDKTINQINHFTVYTIATACMFVAYMLYAYTTFVWI